MEGDAVERDGLCSGGCGRGRVREEGRCGGVGAVEPNFGVQACSDAELRLPIVREGVHDQPASMDGVQETDSYLAFLRR